MSDAWTSDEEQSDQRRLRAEPERASRVLGWVVLGVFALQLIVLRLSGELRAGLPGALFMLFAFCVELYVGWLRWPAMSRLHLSESVTRLPPWPGWIDEVSTWGRLNRASLLRVGKAWLGGAVVAGLLVATLSLPATGAFALIVGWGCVLLLEGSYFAFGCGWRRIRFEERAELTVSANQDTASAVSVDSRSTTPAASLVRPSSVAIDESAFGGVFGDDDAELDDENGEVLPPDVLQQTTRTRLADGGEAIEQFVRCPFPRAEAFQVIHVAFCPPLAGKPEIVVDSLSGPEASIKVTLAETFGARVEVRLGARVDDGGDVVLRLCAVG